MNKENYIYSKVLDKLGFFEPKDENYRIKENYNQIHVISGCEKPITENTAIAYYPGAFGTFHAGHVSAVTKAIEYIKTISPEDYVVVISPANSDYTIEKYGKDSVYSRNDYRFGKICEALEGIEGNVAIDLAPMLNSTCDHNFPTLLKDFVETRDSIDSIESLKHKPVVIVGKDRKDFALMKLVVDDIDFLYVEDTTGKSTSQIKSEDSNSVFKKKKVLLRCEKKSHYHLFVSYFAKEYETIFPLYIEDEFLAAHSIWNENKIDFTICKEYIDIGIPYQRLSRKFKHALDVPKEFIHDEDISFEGKLILDSDVYSGETKRYIESRGGKLISVMDFTNETGEWEIVDFNDFLNTDFCYPDFDIATRCSMRSFSHEDHKNYKNFVKRARDLI